MSFYILLNLYNFCLCVCVCVICVRERVYSGVCGSQRTILGCHFSPSNMGSWNQTQNIKLAEQILLPSESFCHANLSNFYSLWKWSHFLTYLFPSYFWFLILFPQKKVQIHILFYFKFWSSNKARFFMSLYLFSFAMKTNIIFSKLEIIKLFFLSSSI